MNFTKTNHTEIRVFLIKLQLLAIKVNPRIEFERFTVRSLKKINCKTMDFSRFEPTSAVALSADVHKQKLC